MEIAIARASRRSVLKVGVAATALLVIGGGATWLWRPGLRARHLTESGRLIFRTVGRAVLEGNLPADAGARERVLDLFLQSLDALLAGLPAASRAELGQLLGLLSVAPGRRWFTGLESDWPQAGELAVAAALRRMQTDPSRLRQQAYHALRDLTNAAFYAQPAQWPLLGYPGPTSLNAPPYE